MKLLSRLFFCFNNSRFSGSAVISRHWSSTMSTDSYLDLVKNKLSALKAKFYFNRGEIDVIYSPAEFYGTLKSKILKAEKRIFLASLYLGKTEDELVNCLEEALKNNPKLKVYFLVDGLRGTREAPSKCSATLLAQLLKDYEDRVDLRLYKTPAVVGWKESVIPKRFNEGLGLQHMKIYGFDDEVLLSGANLSSDYFTNRQDRYYLFKSKPFAEYYFQLHQLISKLSFKVTPSNNLQKFRLCWPKTNLADEPKYSKKKFIAQSTEQLRNFLQGTYETQQTTNREFHRSSDSPTIVYPISQFTPLFVTSHDYSTEKPTLLSVLSTITHPSINWTFTAGYFNMLPDIMRKLISTPSTNCTVITASPYANGFFKSKGVSSNLPGAYLHLSKKFLENVKRCGKESNITLREWQRGIVNQPGGWSYHAKGIWISDINEGDDRPLLTCIGSSNYTRRAYSSDLETNALIVTTDKELRDKMKNELNNLIKYTKPVNLSNFENEPERKISVGVKIATAILGSKL
ncbi:PGS1 (YCL004W) [Zygosaccharomyces parabailii]|nr:PGS1 (YCL004W) [Zygosaccharomyces parabailii]